MENCEMLRVVTAFASSPVSDGLAMSVLKIKNGKFITIRKFRSKMILCAVEKQDEQENGTAWTRNSCVKQAFWHIQLGFTYLLSKNVAFSLS